MGRKQILKLVFGSLLLLWFVPLFQNKLHLIEESPLSGSYASNPDITFNFTDWFSGDYQQVKEKYLSENFGLRSYFIKFNNQLQFNLFHSAKAQDVIVGKENYLYENKYLISAEGEDFIGSELLKIRIRMLKQIQDTLASQGKFFFIIYAPSKVSFYEEYLPRNLRRTANTNFLKQTGFGNQLGLNRLNLNQVFLRMKGKSAHRLYPQTGTHWSVYGMHVALDSICRYIERKTAYSLCKMDYSKVVLTDDLRTPDNDMEEAMNVFIPPKHHAMAYPKNVKIDSVHKDKPRFLIVADSYWMGIYFTELPQQIFKEHEFWYYNQQNYTAGLKSVGDPNKTDITEVVSRKDVIAIMASEAQLEDFGWGFIERLYATYYPDDKQLKKYTAEMKRIMLYSQIINTSEWKKNILDKARQNHISFEKQLKKDLDWMMEE